MFQNTNIRSRVIAIGADEDQMALEPDDPVSVANDAALSSSMSIGVVAISPPEPPDRHAAARVYRWLSVRMMPLI